MKKNLTNYKLSGRGALKPEDLRAGDAFQDQPMPDPEINKFEKPFWRWFLPISFYVISIIITIVYWNTLVSENYSVSYGMIYGVFFVTVVAISLTDFPSKRARLKANELGFIEGPFGAVHTEVDQPGTKLLFLQRLRVFPLTLIENPTNYLSPEVLAFLQEKKVKLSEGMIYVVETNHKGIPNSDDELELPQAAYWIVVVRFRLIARLIVRFLRYVGSVSNLRDLASEPATQAVQAVAGQNTLRACISDLTKASLLIRTVLESYIREPIYDHNTGRFTSVMWGSWCVSVESVSVQIFLPSELTAAQEKAAAAIANKRTTITDAEAYEQKQIHEGKGDAYRSWITGVVVAKLARLTLKQQFEALGIQDDAAQKMHVYELQQLVEAYKNNTKYVVSDAMLEVFKNFATKL